METTLEKREKTEVKHSSPEQLIDSGNAYSPDVDIWETEDGLVFLVDLPGVKKGGVSIELDENDVLVLKAKTSASEPDARSRREFRVGDYYRAFSLSNEFDKDRLAAQLENGQLKLTVPRREEVKPRKIQIQA